MAAPELLPSAGEPWISKAAWPLKRSRRAGPSVQCEEAKAEKGVMVPLAARTYQRSRSCGLERNGASPWA